MFVCCECCVLSGRGLCDELITRPEESYLLWCVVVCDLETSRMNEEAMTRVGSQHHKISSSSSSSSSSGLSGGGRSTSSSSNSSYSRIHDFSENVKVLKTRVDRRIILK